MSKQDVFNHRAAMEVASTSQRTLNSSAVLEPRSSAVSFSRSRFDDVSSGSVATEVPHDLSGSASENTTSPTSLKTRETTLNNNVVQRNSVGSDFASTSDGKRIKERNRVVSSNKPDKYSSVTNSSSGPSDSTVYSASQVSHSKTLHKRFHLPESENLLGEFACALGKGVLMQGKLYMTNNYLCFFSGLFGRPLRVVIPFKDILSIRKRNVAMIFPTAIQVVLKDGKKYFFASFLARNLAFQRIYLCWTLFKQGKLADLKSIAELDKLLETYGNEEDDNEDMHTVDDSVVSYSEDSETQSQEVQGGDEEQKKIAETIKMFESEDFTQASMFDSSFTDQDHLLVSCTLPISVLHLGELIALNTCSLRNDAEEMNSLQSSSEEEALNSPNNVLEEYHELRGDSNLQISKWKRHSTLGCIRTISYYSPVHNKALAVGISKTRNEERQRICLNPDKSLLLVEWTNQLLDIPFGDTFTMQTRMEARELPRNKSGTPECEVRMYLNVDWKKKVMWRRMIESNIHRETTESYETFIKVLKKHIQNDHVMDEGNTKSKAKEKLKVQTDLAESSQKNKSSSSRASWEDALQSANRKENLHARLGSLETQLYALFIFVLLISLVVLISFFFVLRSERTQVQVLHNRITQLEELLEGVQHDAKCSKALIPQAEYGKDAPLLKEQDLQRLDSLVTQLNEVASSLYSQLSLSKGTKES